MLTHAIDAMTPISFSIIIPHHNIPDLLERCIASIPQRDDVEIIVVDDRSSPSVVDFDNFPGRERKDVKVIFNKEENRGAGGARNIGIGAARGKWLLFIDADDYFNPCVGQMMDAHKDDNADIVFFRANGLDSETYEASPAAQKRVRALNGYFREYQYGDRQRGETLLRYAWGEPWAKFYGRKFVEDNSLFFKETPMHNDTTFAYTAGFHAKTVAVDPHCLVCVTWRQGSLSHTLNTAKLLACIEVFAEKERFMADLRMRVKDDIDRSPYAAAAQFLLRGDRAHWAEAKAIFRRYGLLGLRFYRKVSVESLKQLAHRIIGH